MEFYFDSNGFKKPFMPDDLGVLRDFLVEDVQSSAAWCKELLSIIQSIEDGLLSEWSGTGNAHTLAISLASVTITNEYTEQSLSDLPLDFFKKTLLEWEESISK